MAIKAGYKSTEIGVIPENWEIKILGEIFRISAAGDLDKSSYSAEFTEIYKFPIYANSTYNKGIYGYSSDYEYNSNSITVTARGALGHAFFRDHSFSAIGRTLVLELYFQTDSAYFSEYINEYIDVVGENTGVPQLTAPQLAKYLVLLPPLTEQKAIAAALSDADDLIASLEALIAKKRAIKQGAMQELLTGRKRLPGFELEWKKTNFSTILRHHSGNSGIIKGKLVSIESSDLYPAFSASGQDVWMKYYELEGDAIVVSAVGSRCGKSFNASGKWSAIANTHVIWPSREVDIKFLGFFINDEDFWIKGGSGQPFVQFKQSFAKELRLPPMEEQRAIVSILFDMDTEIAQLEDQLSKTQALKQGMMQELLTGRIQLV